MVVYRIGRTKYARDITGEGARLNGGRWNHKLTSCICTSASRALAVLEYTVNINIEDIPRTLSITTFDLGDLEIYEVQEEVLPGNWKVVPAPFSTKEFGTRILRAAEWPVIKIPSTVIPNEFNYLLNPSHPETRKIEIVSVKDFVYDVRVKLV